jgi:hypothetical protein
MKYRIIAPCFLLLVITTLTAFAQQTAPDASLPGPLPTASGEYDLGAQIDNLALPGCQPSSGYDCKVDVRARVYRPQTLSGTYPVVIFLHGNHATCGRPYQSPPDPPGMLGNPRMDTSVQYTGTGTCPANYVESPSYLGYEYMATRLASYGYIVVSVNVNRGINGGPSLGSDSGLIRARGVMVLRHLQSLSKWNRHGGTPAGVGAELQGHLDFHNIGMMGHSRGGDGVRSAYNVYTASGSPWPGMIEDPITFKGIFEIAPVDFFGYNSKGVAWNIIAGMCDGDVYDLEGLHPYDRDILPPFETTPLQKSTIVVWGANHNFFNTEWQVSDGTDLTPPNYPSICSGTGNNPLFTMSPGSPQQRLTSISSLLAFFRANVGSTAQASFNRNFNPWWGIPSTVTDESGATQPYPTRSDRGFTPAVAIKVFEDFTGPTGTSSYGFPNLSAGITITHGRMPDHDSSLRAASISWNAGTAIHYFQTNWTAAGSGADMSAYTTLELRVVRQSSNLNPSTPTDFSISLAGSNSMGTGPVNLSDYTDPNFAGHSGNQSLLNGPVGSTEYGAHTTLQTVRIPLADFPGWEAAKRNVHGIRFNFNRTTQGAIYLANIRLSNAPVNLARQQGAQDTEQAVQQGETQSPAQAPSVRLHSGVVASVRQVPALAQRAGVSGVEIEIVSANAFPVRDNLLTLNIGPKYFTSSRYASPDLHRVVFSLTAAEYAAVSPAAPVVVQYGKTPRGEVWNCGKLK